MKRPCSARAFSPAHRRGPMNDDDLLRYSRHLLLDDIGIEGQERLLGVARARRSAPAASARRSRSTSAAPASAGSRSSTATSSTHQPAAPDRARPRPRRHAEGGVGGALGRRDQPGVHVVAAARARRSARLDALVADADVVVDCSDNFATRQAVNAACVAHARPLVAGAAIGFDGQLSVYDTRAPRRRATPAPSRRTRPSSTSPARRWACSRRWSASSAACRRPRR